MRQRTQKLIRFLRHPRCQHIGLVFSEPFQLVEEGQFLLLFLRVLLDLAFLTANLGLEDLSFTLGRQERAGSHRKCAGQHACQAADQNRKSTSLNSSHSQTSYAAKYLKKKNVSGVAGYTGASESHFVLVSGLAGMLAKIGREQV